MDPDLEFNTLAAVSQSVINDIKVGEILLFKENFRIWKFGQVWFKNWKFQGKHIFSQNL